MTIITNLKSDFLRKQDSCWEKEEGSIQPLQETVPGEKNSCTYGQQERRPHRSRHVKKIFVRSQQKLREARLRWYGVELTRDVANEGKTVQSSELLRNAEVERE